MHSRFLKLTAVCGLLTILGTIPSGMTPALGQFKKVISTQSELELLSQRELRQQALQITVKVSANDGRGSGTLLTKQGNLYTVLTNAHVLISGAPLKVQTPDGQSHSATLVESIGLQGKDIALLQFQSKHEYKVASLAKVPKLTVKGGVVAAGFPYNSNRPLVTTGKISLLPNQPLEAGYQIGYSNDIEQGMSGGPILNEHGQLVGINALSAYPILNTAYVFEDGSRPSEKQIAEMRRSSWGVPIQILDKIAPQVLTKALGSCIEPSTVFNKSTKSVQKYHVNTCDTSSRTGQMTLLAQNTSEDFYNRGKERVKARDFSGAVAEFTRAITIDSKNADAFEARGNAYVKLGQSDLAIKDYTQAIKLSPENTTYHFWRGTTYLDQEKYAEAVVDLTKVLEQRHPDTGLVVLCGYCSHIYFYRGWAYKKLGKYDLSAIDLSQVLRFPHEADNSLLRDAYLSRGDIYLIQGKQQLAVEDWSKTAKLPPPKNVSEGQKRVEQIAHSTTVKIELLSKDNQIKGSGSGILAARNGKEYYILTNQHVVNNESGNYWIVTPDKKRYLVNRNSIKTQPGFDLAVIQFSSDQEYTIATFADYDIISNGRRIVTAGWSFKDGKWNLTNGFVLLGEGLIGSALDSSFLSDGYEIVYTNTTYGGMSGGAVLDALGQVIGIHGREVGQEDIEISWGLSMGIPSNAFLRLSQDLGINPEWLKRSQSIPNSTQEDEMLEYYPLSYSPNEYNIRVRVLVENPENPEAYFNFANRLFRIGGNNDFVDSAFKIAFELQKRVGISDSNQLYDGLLARAVTLGYSEPVLQLLDTAISTNRKRFQAWGMKATVYQQLKDPNQSLVAVNEALKLEPKNPGLLLQKGNTNIELKQPKEAISAYTQAINRYEEQYKQKNVIPYYVARFYGMRGIAYRQIGDRDSAIKDLTRSVAINPYGGLCQALSELYSETGDTRATQALVCYLDTVARNFESHIGDGVPEYFRGQARLIEGKYDDAVALLTQAINERQKKSQKTSHDSDLISRSYNLRGQALTKLKKYKEALADFDQAIKLLPDNGSAYFFRSGVYADLKDMPKAFSDMQKAAELFKAGKDELNYQAALQIMQQWRQNNQPK